MAAFLYQGHRYIAFSHSVILLSSMQCVKGYMVTLKDFDYQYLF